MTGDKLRLFLAAVCAVPMASFGTMAHAELLTVQGEAFADLTRNDASVDVSVGDNSRGSRNTKCGIMLRSNKPFAFTKEMNALAKTLTVTEQFNGELSPAPRSGGLSLAYLYTSKSAYGTSVTVATRSGETLAQAVAAAFVGATQTDDAPAQVIMTLIPCTK